ncbi:MAG: hypothetical protein HQM08_23330 [Candidatus Riflebacteria bacterium]|nr:hypothetical protein [Candidatus Riflebacteria bacterium]
MNTNPDNANDGDWFIDSEAHFGLGSDGYSSIKIEKNTWHRLGMVIDADKKSRRYFIDGLFSHEALDVNMDGCFAINSLQNEKPICLFFADDNGEDAAIDVRRIILYETPLSDAQMKILGDCSQSRFGL